MPRIIPRSLLLLLTILSLETCAPPGARTENGEQSARQGVIQSPIGCHLEANVRSGLCAERATLYFHDEEDGGDDPLVAGCHVSFTDPVCTMDGTNASGDRCMNSDNLKEWTRTDCHIGPDLKDYSCDSYCRSLGHASGECKQTPKDFCAPHGSAYCKCTGPA
jgi:hypothetical protein